jgi:hypothetical protein
MPLYFVYNFYNTLAREQVAPAKPKGGANRKLRAANRARALWALWALGQLWALLGFSLFECCYLLWLVLFLNETASAVSALWISLRVYGGCFAF